MKPGSMWLGIVLVAAGVCGLLDAAGVVDSTQTIGQWWPLAVIGWPLVEMAAARRLTALGVVCAAFGVALLADAQGWTNDTIVWSVLALAVGLTVLVTVVSKRSHRDDHGQQPGAAPLNGGAPVNGAA